MGVGDGLLGELREHQRFGAEQRFLDRDLGHGELDGTRLELREIQDHVDQRHEVLLRLVNPPDVAALVLRQPAVDVLLKDLQVTRHGVQRRPELVAQAGKELGLDAIRRFRLLARRPLSFERELELASPLRDARVEGAIERANAVFGFLAAADVAHGPAERFLAVGC